MLGGTGLVICALLYRLGSPTLFDDPNEAQYAEVAREMVETGEWVSPQLNYVLFLNKPPLLYWMIAASYSVFGVNEAAARLPGGLITLLTVALVYFLGRALFDTTTGLLAAAAYAGMPSTVIEARLVRPDVLLTAATTATMLAFVKLAPAKRRHGGAAAALSMALAAGVMAKGIVAVVLVAFPIFLALVIERRTGWLGRVVAGRHWFWFALLVLPWHVVAALRHSGFAWDYLVNQHFLFFFDWKLPRDSVPVGLPTFWAAFLLRTFPWTLFLPLAIVVTVRTAPTRVASVVLLAWVAGVLLFFSAASSRLEHYVLPALPAVAILIGRLFGQWSELGRAWRVSMTLGVAALCVLLAAAVWSVPSEIMRIDWLGAAKDLPWIARLFLGALLAASLTALAIMPRRPLAPILLLAATTVTLTPVIHRGLLAIAPVNSSAPIAAVLQAHDSDRVPIIFEAPIEYQHCAGLNFYLQRAVTIVRPTGFVEPTYLTPLANRLFIDRHRLESLWTRELVYFVSDPLAPPSRALSETVPRPFFIVARAGSRWILRNRPP